MPALPEVRIDASVCRVPEATPASRLAAALKVGSYITNVCNAEGFRGAGVRVLAHYPSMGDTLMRLGHAFQYYGVPSLGLQASRGNFSGAVDAVVPLYEAIGTAFVAALPAVETRAGQAVAAAIVYILHAHGEGCPSPRNDAARDNAASGHHVREDVARDAVEFLDMACRLGEYGNLPAVMPRPFDDRMLQAAADKLERYVMAQRGTDEGADAADRVRAYYQDPQAMLATLGSALRRGDSLDAAVVPNSVFDQHMALTFLAAAPEPWQRQGDIAASAIIRALDGCREGSHQDRGAVYEDLYVFLGTCRAYQPPRSDTEHGG